MGDGFEAFVASVIFMGVVFSLLGVCLWVLYSKKGQRLDRKQRIRYQVRQGMRDEEIEEGLFEEVIDELAEKELAKRRKKQGTQ